MAGKRSQAVAVLALLSCMGCASAQPIERPRADDLMVGVAQGRDDRMRVSARVLNAEQSKAMLRAPASERDLVPVLFAVSNDGGAALPIRQDDFRLRIDGPRRIAPSLPGRAATLLRDERASTEAIWAGYLLFGVFAAPSIHSAEKKEADAVHRSHELLFSSLQIAPGDTAVGYLVFESPLPVDEVAAPVLEVHTPSGGTMELPLTNPYFRSHD